MVLMSRLAGKGRLVVGEADVNELDTGAFPEILVCKASGNVTAKASAPSG
ncbi:hypothetical protein OROMI_008741 [Orobanche minor]